jgi:OmpA-like transmembrane domain
MYNPFSINHHKEKTMKNSILALIVAGTSVVISPALAYRYYPAPAPAPFYNAYSPRDSFYIAGDVGVGSLATPEQVLIPVSGPITGASYETGKSIAASGSVGFKHALNPHVLLGAELGYDYNGASKYTEDYTPDWTYTESTTYRISSQDLHVLATGTLVFGRGFNIFAKGGAARVRQTLRITNQVDYSDLPFYLGGTTLVGYKPMAAVGMGYQFRAVEIYAQYSHIFGTDASNFYPDLFNENGSFANIVSSDTIKMGLAFHIPV